MKYPVIKKKCDDVCCNDSRNPYEFKYFSMVGDNDIERFIEDCRKTGEEIIHVASSQDEAQYILGIPRFPRT